VMDTASHARATGLQVATVSFGALLTEWRETLDAGDYVALVSILVKKIELEAELALRRTHRHVPAGGKPRHGGKR
jgi:hypothetical protein